MYTIYILVIFIITLLIWILTILNGQSSNADDNNDGDEDFKFTAEYKSSPSNALKRNCDAEIIYAMDDNQCLNICRDTGIFQVSNGRCVNVLALDNNNPNNNCDPKRGVLAYLIGDPQLGRTQFKCLSVDLGIQDDSLASDNILCKDGVIKINYLENMPQLKHCKCPSDKILAIIPNNKTIRTHGQCVNKNLRPVLEYNNAVFNPNVV